MITDLKTTIGYKCANCNRNNYRDITIFDINPQKPLSLTCSCGAQLGDIRYKTQGSYVIHSTCCYCTDQHSFYIDKKHFWNRELLSYACPTAQLIYIALGENHAVHEEMKQADKDFEALIANMQNSTEDMKNDQITFHLLEKIQELDNEKKLYCTCGNHELLIDMQDDDIIIMCGDCGQRFSIDITDDTAVNTFLQAESLILQGRKK